MDSPIHRTAAIFMENCFKLDLLPPDEQKRASFGGFGGRDGGLAAEDRFANVEVHSGLSWMVRLIS
jgi:hypothetical protein